MTGKQKPDVKRKDGFCRGKQMRRAVTFIRPYKKTVLLIMALALGVAALEAVEPLVLKFIFDRLGPKSFSFKILLFGIGGLLAAGLFREAVGGLSNRLAWKVRLGVNYGLLQATVSRLHSLPLAYHRNESVGGIMTKLDRGINGLVEALSEIAVNMFPGLVYLVLSLIIMFRLEWRLSLLVMFFAPLPALIGMHASVEQTGRERALIDRWSKIFSRFNEVLSGIITVKSFAMEDTEKKKFLDDVEGANSVVLKGVGTDTRVGALKNIMVLTARIAAIALGAYLIGRNKMTPGTLVAFLGYIGGLFGPVQGLTGVYQVFRKASVSVDIVYSILDADCGLSDSPGARALRSVRGEVVFENVSFGYGSGKPVLSRINLHVKPGESVALVGPSGAGKTTMMSLLQRFYDPSAGCVRIDGRDIRELRQDSLRKQIGAVSQDSMLFNDSIFNNIAYGRPGAPAREVEEAARAANAHDFIMRLPGGYNACAGEQGGRLSAGERQRISIARALLKNPPILIFDEATSALDAESEALVQEAVGRLVKGRTTFIIAHRLSTVVGADRILVLKDAGIMESGSHEALMRTGGYYASLVARQTNGLLVSHAA